MLLLTMRGGEEMAALDIAHIELQDRQELGDVIIWVLFGMTEQVVDLLFEHTERGVMIWS
jgi:hypothetical protein